MLGALRARWQNVINGLWFVPGAVALSLALLAVALVEVDGSLGARGAEFAFGGDAPAARAVLSSIAVALITVAGVTLSITIVTLQLVSQQFTPRALRNFLGDRLTQVVAGSFVGTFAYCLIALRAVRDDDPRVAGEFAGFVPALAVSVSMVLALVSLALLIGFIHHIATSVQVSRIAAQITRRTLRSIDALYPEPAGAPEQRPFEEVLAEWRREPSERIAGLGPGSVQAIDVERLAGELAARRLALLVEPGDFVTPRTAILELWPEDACDEAAAATVRSLVVVSDERDLGQDVGYGLRQLVDIAVRALSPGVNDPTTAVHCIAYARSILERLAERAAPAPLRRFPGGDADVLAKRTEFADLARETFSELALHAAGNPRVAVEALDSLTAVAGAVPVAARPSRVPALVEAGRHVAAHALGQARVDEDRQAIAEALGRLER